MFSLPSSPSRSNPLLALTLISVIGLDAIYLPARPPASPKTEQARALGPPTTPEHFPSIEKDVAHAPPTSSTNPMTAALTPGRTTQARLGEIYGKLPLSFEPNVGQADPNVKFFSRGAGYRLHLLPTEAAFYLSRGPGGRGHEHPTASRGGVRGRTATSSGSVVRMRLLGAGPTPWVEGRDELTGRSNYLIGGDPRNWRTDVPNYARVEYRSVYPGVDMVYYGNWRQLEYDFVVAPGTSPRVIRLAFEGARGVRIDARGELVVRTTEGELRQRKPVVYQETGGARRYVEGRYVMRGRREVGFEVASYDVGRPLVIDPVLIYSSFLGGGGDDFAHAVAADDFGNVYVVGETTSTDFPVRTPFQTQNRGNVNAFVTKINAAGSALLYSTYIGGSLFDRAYAVALDRAGAVLLTGVTSSFDFPTRNPIQSEPTPSFNGAVDAFVAKLTPAGSGLVFSTYLGGPGFDNGHGIAADDAGNVYVTGSAGLGWPTTVQAFQPDFRCCGDDAFVTKLNPTGTEILYSTYLGGSASELGRAIAVDAAQNAYVTGYTESPFNFPTRNALQASFGGGEADAFVAKIPTVTTSFVFLQDTFDNENGGEPSAPYAAFANWNVTSGQPDLVIAPATGRGLVVNLNGHLTQGATLATKAPLLLNATTYRLKFDLTTFAVGPPSPGAVTVRLGNLFAETFTPASLGTSASPTVVRDIRVNAPTSAVLSFEHAGGTGAGVFLDDVSVFEGAGAGYVTFLGGGGAENMNGALGGGIKVDAAGNAYVSGSTASDDFPVANALQLAPAGGSDVFVSKLNPAGSALLYSTYFGGAADDFANGLAIDQAGNTFVVGHTLSSNFPVKNAVQATFGGETRFSGDGFAFKLSATGGELVYSTYVGGEGQDVARGVAVDAAGNAVLVGYTTSVDFPLAAPLQAGRGGFFEAFVSKLPAATGTGVPDVSHVSPSSVGNSGVVTFQLRGENLAGLPVGVRLVGPGGVELRALRVMVKGASLAAAAFDLTGAAPGSWDIIVEFGDGRSKRLSGAVNITAGGQPRVWVDLIGPRVIRGGRKQVYHVVVGNSGNVDAFQVPVWVKAPRAVEPKIKVPLTPPPDPRLGPVDWNTVPQQVETETDLVTPGLIPHLPAQATRTIPVEVNPQGLGPFGIQVWANPPLIVSLDLNPERVFDCFNNLTSFLAEEAIEAALPFDCLQQLRALGKDVLVDIATGALTSLNDQTIVSYTQLAYGLMSAAAKCARDFSPHFRILKGVAKLAEIAEQAAKDAALGAILGHCVSAFLKITTPTDPNRIDVVLALDPNDKLGPVGAGPPRYVAGAEPLRYAIYFENKPTATAPAQDVTITDQLDASLLDLSTFSLGPISFGSRRVTPATGATDFDADVDLRPDRNLIVRVSARLDAATGRLTWKFVSLDPATGLPPADPLAGFLPPNVNPPEGDGHVFFTVSPKTGLPTDTVINNAASIVFDDNPALATPVWTNRLDNSAPASRVHALPATQSSASFSVQWSGADAGSGIRDFTIYVSDDGGPFTPWLIETTATQATFNSAANHTYAFLSVSRDAAGNSELAKTSADTSTRVVAAGSISGRVTHSVNGLAGATITLTGPRAATTHTDAAGNYSFSDLPAGTYTLTPSQTNFTFSPVSQTLNLNGNGTANFTAALTPGIPVLISEETSTRALAVESVVRTREPFPLNSQFLWGVDRRTRVMLFAMNFDLLPGETISAVTADAEDASHRVYPLTVEHVGRVQGFDWLSCVVVKLHDDMGDIGDVLIRIRVRGVSSNRVRLGIGHVGGGPPDDPGAGPTPGREP